MTEVPDREDRNSSALSSSAEGPQKKYRLLDEYGKAYDSAAKGKVGGHRALKIYGRMDCPSALQHLAKGQYKDHRVFFADEQTAIRAGYRPCGNCMKGQYHVYKENGKTTELFPVTAAIPEDLADALVSVKLKNGEEKQLHVTQIEDPELVEYARDEDIEAVSARLDGPYCVINLRAFSDQWGRTIVWLPGSDEIVHLSKTSFGYKSAIVNDKVATLYLVHYWGKPAEPMYSIQPLETHNLESKPEVTSLPLAAPENWDDAEAMQIEQGASSVTFIVDGERSTVPIK